MINVNGYLNNPEHTWKKLDVIYDSGFGYGRRTYCI